MILVIGEEGEVGFVIDEKQLEIVAIDEKIGARILGRKWVEEGRPEIIVTIISISDIKHEYLKWKDYIHTFKMWFLLSTQ